MTISIRPRRNSGATLPQEAQTRLHISSTCGSEGATQVLHCHNEADFQGLVLSEAKNSGFFSQKFQDSLSLGVPDIYLASPEAACWVELKWCEIPTRATTVLGPRVDLKGYQLAWLLKAHRRPSNVLAGMLLGTPRGWLAVPAPRCLAVLALPSAEVVPQLSSVRPTPSEILRLLSKF